MKRNVFLLGLFLMAALQTKAQEYDKQDTDSLYLEKIEHHNEPLKLLHAEPLYIDLIRDLGARKGEKEWNIGMGLTDNNKYDAYTALVEYEWAPINRLGFEVELPFSFYYPTESHANAPSNKLNSVKLATQYTFLVNASTKTSMALGYIHEFEMNDFKHYSSGSIFTANVFSPFYVVAKRWGQNFHTLIYTGPTIIQHLESKHTSTYWQVNTNFHYMIPGTRNFVGVEFNKQFHEKDFDMTIRPQMRLGISEQLMLGIVTGIPISRENERFSTFLRLIYEPSHKSKK